MKCSRPLALGTLVLLAACEGQTARPRAEPSVAGGFASVATTTAWIDAVRAAQPLDGPNLWTSTEPARAAG